jgi:hypothetical protein
VGVLPVCTASLQEEKKKKEAEEAKKKKEEEDDDYDTDDVSRRSMGGLDQAGCLCAGGGAVLALWAWGVLALDCPHRVTCIAQQ